MLKLSPALCEKITKITEDYIKDNPIEWINFRSQQKVIRDNLKTKWAEVNGEEGIVIREILQTPETLYTLFKMKLSPIESLEFNEERYKLWFGNKFPDFRTSEGRL